EFSTVDVVRLSTARLSLRGPKRGRTLWARHRERKLVSSPSLSRARGAVAVRSRPGCQQPELAHQGSTVALGSRLLVVRCLGVYSIRRRVVQPLLAEDFERGTR